MRAERELRGTVVAVEGTSAMQLAEFARLKRRMTDLLDVDPGAAEGVEGLRAAAAVDTFNAEAADLRGLLEIAEGELRLFGVLPEDLGRTLREVAELRECRRRELLSTYDSLVF